MTINKNKASTFSRILGIDPGTNILGFAVIEVDGDKIAVLEIGVLHLKDKGEHTDKLKEIFLSSHSSALGCHPFNKIKLLIHIFSLFFHSQDHKKKLREKRNRLETS
jgi:hypothetical protein